LNKILNKTHCTCHHYTIHDPQSIHALPYPQINPNADGQSVCTYEEGSEAGYGDGLWRTGKDVNTVAQTVTHWATDHL